MKTTILATMAATLMAPMLASPALAQYRGHDRTVTTVRERPNGRTVVTTRTDDRRGGYRSWRRGERFDRRYAQNYQEIDYRRYRGLRAPPRGYRYVRSGNDAVLVGITSGIIASVLTGAIR